MVTQLETGMNTHAHTHCSIAQPLSTYDILLLPLAFRTPPFTDDNVAEASTSKGHPAATRIVTCHHHCSDTHAVREVWGVRTQANRASDIRSTQIQKFLNTYITTFDTHNQHYPPTLIYRYTHTHTPKHQTNTVLLKGQQNSRKLHTVWVKKNNKCSNSLDIFCLVKIFTFY